jgi:hypothetical protein
VEGITGSTQGDGQGDAAQRDTGKAIGEVDSVIRSRPASARTS